MNSLQKLITGCVALVACNACSPVLAQVGFGSATEWHKGKALEKAKSLPVSVSYTESPLRNQLIQFGVQRQRSIFVDRRVDPTLKQTRQFFDVTTEQVVWQTAAENGLGVARVGDLLFVGPKQSASRLPFAIAAANKDLSKLGKDVRRKWNQRTGILWRDATTTTELAKWFETNHGIIFREPIPFDVWPAADWPELTLLEQMSLVLVGFDLAFEIDKDGRTVSFVKFPAIETGSRKFKTNSEPFEFEKAKSRFSNLRFAKSGRTVSVKGNVEQISKLEAWIVEKQTLSQDQFERTFDINDDARRGDILATIAQQTGRQLELQGNAGDLLAQRIKVNLRKASLETLIGVCLEGTGLRYKLSNSKLTISDK
jgi:hypothetical protein